MVTSPDVLLYVFHLGFNEIRSEEAAAQVTKAIALLTRQIPLAPAGDPGLIVDLLVGCIVIVRIWATSVAIHRVCGRGGPL